MALNAKEIDDMILRHFGVSFGDEIYLQANALLKQIDKLQKADRPKIVCLCGSSKFLEQFRKANFDETLKGNIVLSIGCDTKNDDDLELTIHQKAALDELHKRKIDLADEILVLNKNGYIGDSTKSEITYAYNNKKRIRWLEHPVEIDDFIASFLKKV